METGGKESKKCRACGSVRNVKWGKRRGVQCYRCKDCGFQFTTETDRRSGEDEKKAITLYCLGFSFRTIGKLMSYHHTTVMRRLFGFAGKRNGDPVRKAEVVLSLGEIRVYVAEQRDRCGLGKRAAGEIDALLRGDAQITIPLLFKDSIAE